MSIEYSVVWTISGVVLAASAVGGVVGVFFATIYFNARISECINHLRTGSTEALLKVFDLFEDKDRKANRREVWRRLLDKRNPTKIEEEEIENQILEADDAAEAVSGRGMARDDWVILEQLFSEMDMVGLFIDRKLIREDIIFSRYAELIIPIWAYFGQHVEHRRKMKKGAGWLYFQRMAYDALCWWISQPNRDPQRPTVIKSVQSNLPRAEFNAGEYRKLAVDELGFPRLYEYTILSEVKFSTAL